MKAARAPARRRSPALHHPKPFRGGLSFWTLLAVLVSWNLWAGAGRTALAAPTATPALVERFNKELWPLLNRGDTDSCVGCHDAENRSDLHFLPDPAQSFTMLVEGGFFSESDPDGLLGRLTASNPKKRMPKGRACPPWSAAEVESLRSFIAEANGSLRSRSSADEQFPAALRLPYNGPAPDGNLDNQFLSYRQLRGKVKSIFGDDWVRNGHDLFQENLALFGGADFKERFNETTKASPTFLSGVQMMAKDVVERAYSRRTGPFAGRAEQFESPLDLEGPDAAYRDEITRLYERILFRPPTGDEMQQAFSLIRSVYLAQGQWRAREFNLGFELTVRDAESGRTSVQSCSIPVLPGRYGLYQEYVDESAEPAGADNGDSKRLSGAPSSKTTNQLGRHTLARSFHLRPHDAGQVLRLFNRQTVGNVSFAGVKLRRVGRCAEPALETIWATNRAVQAEGAWNLERHHEHFSYEDGNNDKGKSSLSVALNVSQAGEYELTLCWREAPSNARSILVEVFSHDPSQLASHPPEPAPPRGEAHAFIDESDDTVAFAALPGAFRFGTNDYVEINNRGTHRRVTADAVRFTDTRTGASWLIDNDEAVGREKWKVYDSGDFKAYNQTGKDSYHDENAHKGELFLRYLPSLKPKEWNPQDFYRVEVGYPAKSDHEVHTPVIVKAAQSSPLVQLSAPDQAVVGAKLVLDGARSYSVQEGPLEFHWEQTAGPPVRVPSWSEAQLSFTVPELDAPAMAWQALARALIAHPDFLFTRPPALADTLDPKVRRRLQLVKITQDLLARATTEAELQELDAGKPLARFVDEYLATPAFQEFYFHRIRLYLESHGTEEQDEPVRLWCYIAFHDRPFQEILTADYTVDASWQRQPRPNWCGRTGVLTTSGFIEGKPGLPHFNFAAQVAELFLGYVFVVPPEVVAERQGSTALSTTDPNSVCYNCHKILTPLAFQRSRWDDLGHYHTNDEHGLVIDDSDRGLVRSYPFAGHGLEAFATQAVKRERFIRTIINTHFNFYFGRELRYLEDERVLYAHLWDEVHRDHFQIRALIKALLTSPEYLDGGAVAATLHAASPTAQPVRVAAAGRLARASPAQTLFKP